MKVRKVWIAIAIFNRRVSIVTRLAGSRLTFPTTFYPSLFELSKIIIYVLVQKRVQEDDGYFRRHGLRPLVTTSISRGIVEHCTSVRR